MIINNPYVCAVCGCSITQGDLYFHVRERDYEDSDKVGVIHASHFRILPA